MRQTIEKTGSGRGGTREVQTTAAEKKGGGHSATPGETPQTHSYAMHACVYGSESLVGLTTVCVCVCSGSTGKTGVSASETAAEQLQGHQEELLRQESRDDY